jgi:hypothetical protein
MENQIPPNDRRPSDEIDLGQLFQMIGRGFTNLFRFFLRLFVYLSRNIIKLGIIILLGLAIGFGLNLIVTKRLKTEVIVKPNLESKNYLYDVVDEIQANIKAADTAFFGEIGIDIEDVRGLRISVEPVEEKGEETNIDDDIKYLELLEKFRGDDLIGDVVRTEILNKSTLNHRITFYYKKAATGKAIAGKLLDYINSNEYFNELVAIYRNNAQDRILQDQSLVVQIDGLVENYSDKLTSRELRGEGRILLDEQEQLDIPGLLNLKNSLIRDIERKKLEIQGQKEAIRVINFGKTQEVQKSFFGKSIVLVPLILIILFFLIDFYKYLNRKAREMQLQ